MAWDSSLGGLQAMLALNLVAFLQARCWRKADRLPLGKVQPLSDRAPSSVIPPWSLWQPVGNEGS
jgi:hypothetical protein